MCERLDRFFYLLLNRLDPEEPCKNEYLTSYKNAIEKAQGLNSDNKDSIEIIIKQIISIFKDLIRITMAPHPDEIYSDIQKTTNDWLKPVQKSESTTKEKLLQVGESTTKENSLLDNISPSRRLRLLELWKKQTQKNAELNRNKSEIDATINKLHQEILMLENRKKTFIKKTETSPTARVEKRINTIQGDMIYLIGLMNRKLTGADAK